MADTIKEPEKEKEVIKNPLETEVPKESLPESAEVPTESGQAEDIKALRQEIEKTDIDDSLKLQAQTQAQDMAGLDEEKKIKKLLELANAKGIIYAVAVAKKMDDPYVLDKLHDTMAAEGLYKNFKQ